ncbi:MAG: endolytic transglycosylase MltG [Marinagarivorans sp.]|nr:endolytic transglycosylase MltG [Marinagarivorans sp.]
MMFKSPVVRMFVSSLLWLIVVFGVAGTYAWQWLTTEHQVPIEHRVWMVEKGHGLARVADNLHDAGILRWPLVWQVYARVLHPKTIKAGEYALSPYESPISLLTLLQGGEVISYKITFAEGLTLKEWLALMAQEPKIKAVAAAMSPDDLLLALNISETSAEGWFFPDTYSYENNDTDLAILKRAHQKMRVELFGQWARRQPSLPFNSPYEALILASIIEEETGTPSERPQIAGVFVQRLKRGMRLQTDPTVIYGMGDEYQGNIRRVHLQTPTPYNTYIINGLPPTPISNPGGAAIAAAINPQEGRHLYFVAKGDGSHEFSATLNEHNNAVKQYQYSRKKNYTSSPQPLATTEPPALDVVLERSDISSSSLKDVLSSAAVVISTASSMSTVFSSSVISSSSSAISSAIITPSSALASSSSMSPSSQASMAAQSSGSIQASSSQALLEAQTPTQ